MTLQPIPWEPGTTPTRVILVGYQGLSRALLREVDSGHLRSVHITEKVARYKNGIETTGNIIKLEDNAIGIPWARMKPKVGETFDIFMLNGLFQIVKVMEAK